ncbi:PP2C family protein-serine/threonine phosphatase [Yinghuangia aomiensis]|uniref:PP2C family protein-serine/threonine phosphatase n=1 Tax=Yinghuangia aomiensis TaxID=676205 RepID=A0ABP9HCS2_9ACTN
MPRHTPSRERPAGLGPLLALVALITVIGIFTPSYVRLAGPLLAVPPALAAARLSPRDTGYVGAASLLGEVVIGIGHYDLDAFNWLVQAAAVVLVSIVGVYLAQLRESQLDQLVRTRRIAEIAQQLVLRPLPPRLGPLRVAQLYLAAEREIQLGGDLYAAVRTRSGTRVLIGDVRGKGLPAVGDAAQLLGAFRGTAHQQPDLVALADILDAGVTGHHVEDGEENLPQESFITAALVDIPDETAVLRLVQCGHPPPLVLSGHRVRVLEAAHTSPPLGLDLGPVERGTDTYAFGAGDVLLLYTDGVVEARDAGGAFYPLAERLPQWSGDSPEDLLDHLRADLLAYAGHRLDDDAAMVAIAREA